jgi:Na+/H+ antiporter NhaC
MKRYSISVIPWLMFIFFAVLVSYFAWQVGKKLTYKYAYKAMVEQTVREMVNGEALK